MGVMRATAAGARILPEVRGGARGDTQGAWPTQEGWAGELLDARSQRRPVTAAWPPKRDDIELDVKPSPPLQYQAEEDELYDD